MTTMTLGEDAAEICVSRMVLDEDRERRRFTGNIWHVFEPFSFEGELASDNHTDAVLLCFLIGANDSVEAVSIRNGDRVVTELGGAKDHELGRRGPGKKAEVRPYRELDVTTGT